jgi:hypothetical protein
MPTRVPNEAGKWQLVATVGSQFLSKKIKERSLNVLLSSPHAQPPGVCGHSAACLNS